MTDHGTTFDRDDTEFEATPEAMSSPPPAPPPPERARPNTRRRAFLILGLIVLVGAGVYLLRMLTAAPSQGTDDA